MNTITRPCLIALALAALGLFAPLAPAQDAAADRPQVEAPDVEASPAEAESDEPEMTWDRAPNRRSARRGNSVSSDGLVSFGSGSTLSAGQRAEAVVSIFGSSTSSGDVTEAVVSVLGNTRIEGGTVGEAAVAVIGDNYVNGKVDGDVVAVLGNIELGPNADVRDGVVVIGGTLKRDPRAQVGGGVQQVMTLPVGALSGMRSWLDNCLRYLRPLAFASGLVWVWTIALSFLAFYVLLALLFREPVERCVKTVEEHPGQTILAALLAMILTPVLLVVLCITVIGIVFVPIVAFGIFVATLFGKAVILAWIGRSMLRFLEKGERINAALAVLAGGVVTLLLYTVPVLGFIIYNLLGILGFGVVAYTVMLAVQARRKTAPPAGRAPGGAGPSPAPGAAAYGAPGAAFTAGPASADAVSASGYAPAGASDPGNANSAAHGYAQGAADASGAAGPQAFGSADPGSPGFGPAGTQGPATPGGASPGGASSPGFGAPGTGGPQGFSAAPGAAYTPPINEAITYARAGFWIRMLALLIDTILIAVALSVIAHTGKLFLVSLATYGAIMWKLKGTTVGGIVCNLKVVRIDGRPMDWPTSVIRALGCFLSLIVVGLGFIWIAFDDGRQSWHDKIAGTAVVRSPQGVSLL